MFERIVLPNGLRLLVCPMPHTYSVSVGFFLGTGSRFEAEPIGGASHFIEHMLFKGTERFPTANDIAITIEGIGGMFNASTGREVTNYWVKVARPHFKTALDVLVDMLRHSRFVQEEIEKERQVIIEEINMTLDVPEDLVQLAISALQWPDNPIGRDVAGTKESVGAMSRSTLLDYMAAHYGPTNTVLAITGNITVADSLSVVQAYLGDWQGGSRQAYVPHADSQTEPRVKVIYRPTEQANLCLSLPGLSRKEPERFVLRLINAILGEGMSSRLFQEIREKQALAYAVESYLEVLDETGALGAYAGVEPDKTDRTIQAILAEWDRLRQQPVSQSELDKTREFVKGRILLRMEDTYAVTVWNGEQELLQSQVMSVEEVIAVLDAITPADILALAQRIFDPSKINLAIVGPFGSLEAPETDRFRRLLAS